MKLILLGAPGAGKGTQAKVISSNFSIPAISTGNIIREAISGQSAMGIQAQDAINKGQLVSDEIVIEIVKERISRKDCENGYILDGFPRTIPQAIALDEFGVEIDAVVDIELDDKQIIERLSGRRICSKCGDSYHVKYNPSNKEGICDECGGELIIRDDDKPETIISRLEVFHSETEPLKDYYLKAGKLRIVESMEDVADTTAATLKTLEDLAW